jgi:hypothetical protein
MAEAQDKVSKSILDVKDASLKQKEAVNGVAKAQLDVESSVLSVIAAQQKQIEFANSLVELAFKAKTADFDVEKARRAVSDATFAVTEAEHNRVVTLQELQKAADDIIDADRGVADARRAVYDATLQIRDAQEAVNKSDRDYAVQLNELVSVKDKITQANLSEELAVRALDDAKHNIIDKEATLAQARRDYKKDLAEINTLEQAVADARVDRAAVDDQLALDAIKRENDKAKNTKDLQDSLSAAEDDLTKARLKRDKDLLQAQYMYPSVFGDKKLTYQEFLQEIMKVNLQAIESVKKSTPELSKSASDVLIAAAKEVDPVKLKNSFQSAMDNMTGLVLKVNTIIDKDADLAVSLGNKVLTSKASATQDFGGNKFTGGPVVPGLIYQVNERGTEHFMSALSGKVSPITGGRHYTAFAEPGVVIPAHLTGPGAGVYDYSDRSHHEYKIYTTVQDPEMMVRQLERQRREMDRRRR